MSDQTIAAQETAGETMLGDLMHMVVEQLKLMPRTWQEMGESEQEEYLYRIRMQSQDMVRRCVQIISSEGSESLPVKITGFSDTAKHDVQVKTELMKSKDLVKILESGSRNALLVLCEAERFMHGQEPEPDPDQGGLDFEEEGEED